MALPAEARPLIDAYKLKKNTAIRLCSLYEGEDISLIVSGPGKLKMALAMSHIFTQSPPSENDFCLNFGICGATSEKYSISTAYLINRVQDFGNKKEYFPDILYSHTFSEASLFTFDTPVYSRVEGVFGLIDMEGSGFMEASRNWFSPHQLSLLKIVSDYLKQEKMEADFVQKLISSNIQFIENYKVLIKPQKKGFRSKLPSELMEKIALIEKSLKLSQTSCLILKENIENRFVREENGLHEILNHFINQKSKVKQESSHILKQLLNALKNDISF